MNITKQKGTRDIYSDDMVIWQYVENIIRDICKNSNIKEIRTPVFEATQLYARSVGEQTDIVNKEMYTFLDRGNRSITLRPELTAGVMRAYIENGMNSMPQPVKLWYTGNMYRYEKMQKGRYREFSQFGVEIFGSNSYLADIETITVANTLFEKLGILDKLTLSINSIGCKTCRQNYIEKLREYLSTRIDDMCDTCKVRYEKNILRIMDCKEEKCINHLKDAPMISDYLCEECNSDFENLKNTLDLLNINYIVDKKIVRGLDYYNKTVYEYISKDLELAVGGGGRYDTLAEQLGASNIPAVGFGIGLDRIILLLKSLDINSKINVRPDIYFLLSDDNVIQKGLKFIYDFKNSENNLITEHDIAKRSFKSQLKYANNIKAKFVCILGETEVKENKCIIKNMDNSSQELVELSIEKILEYIER